MTSAPRRLMTSITSVGLVALTVSCGKEKPIESGRGFVTTVPGDTLTESFSRTKQQLRGVITSRRDSITYLAVLGDSGLVQSVDISVYSRAKRDVPVDPRHVLLRKGTLPWVMGSGALLEQILRRIRVLGRDSVTVPVTFVAGNSTTDLFTVTSNAPDSLILTGVWGGRSQNTLRVSVDTAWHVTGMTLPRTEAVMRPAE